MTKINKMNVYPQEFHKLMGKTHTGIMSMKINEMRDVCNRISWKNTVNPEQIPLLFGREVRINKIIA